MIQNNFTNIPGYNDLYKLAVSHIPVYIRDDNLCHNKASGTRVAPLFWVILSCHKHFKNKMTLPIFCSI